MSDSSAVVAAVVVAVPALLAALVSVMTYFDNRRGHGNLDRRFAHLEKTICDGLKASDRRIDHLETAILALSVRQEAHETIQPKPSNDKEIDDV